jgi:hypothetical protein
MAEQLTYSYKPRSGAAKDKLRLMIPDRPVKNRQPEARFADEELLDIIDIAGNDLTEATATACEIIATDETKRMLSVSINSGMSISRSNTPSAWLQRAKQIRDAALKVPWEFVDNMHYDVDGLGRDITRYADIDGWDGGTDD